MTLMGQCSYDNNSREHIRTATQLFKIIGASTTERDTIPGRQCMASCFFLARQFEDVMVYFTSIKSFMANDDDFNWNHGIALAATKDFKAAEDAFNNVQSEA